MSDTHAHEHPSYLAHHFETPEQQLTAQKLGMWLFLATELLFFGGLFCAYAVYRSNHPEIFQYAHRFLDVKLGALNTVVLLVSSFTMALAVRAAQLADNKAVFRYMAITLLCALAFLGVKAVEYSHKAHEGLLWGRHFNPSAHAEAEALGSHGGGAGGAGGAGTEAAPAVAPTPTPEAAASGPTVQRPRNAHVFFGIYFCMTGLHAIHIIGGIGVIAWIMVRARRGEFHEKYYGPVENVGLYWHLVDLIWIYLFPLLYLIR